MNLSLTIRGWSASTRLLSRSTSGWPRPFAQVDTHHVLILGGAQWDNNFSVFGPPFDKNVIYTFHRYHAPAEQATVQKYVDFRDQYNVPIWLGESGENSDEWIAKFVAVLEKNDIGWAFWPYKKMQATTSVVSFAAPEGWDSIVQFSKAAASHLGGGASSEGSARTGCHRPRTRGHPEQYSVSRMHSESGIHPRSASCEFASDSVEITGDA